LSTVSLSFPSTHSASAAALAVVVVGLDPRLKWGALIFAAGIGLGAIYTGGHYPLDVAAGYGVGIVLGFALRGMGKVGAYCMRPDGLIENGGLCKTPL